MHKNAVLPAGAVARSNLRRFTILIGRPNLLGRKGPPAKMSEGYYRFLCPGCGEMRATVNPRNNLAHCFTCGQNYNNIDVLIALGYTFRYAVTILEQWLDRYETCPTGGV